MSISPSEEQREVVTIDFPKYCYSSDFLVISESPAFIDKTLLIKRYFEGPIKHCIIIAPPGYGKSTNLDMLKRFVEIDVDPQTGEITPYIQSTNYKIFRKPSLRIYRELQIFQQYSAKFIVIYLSLKNVYGNTFERVVQKFAENLSQSFQQHRYLMEIWALTATEKQRLSAYLNVEKCKKLSLNQLECGLAFLAEMLVKHYIYKKVFLFVDDYDYPCAKITMEWSRYDKPVSLFFDRIFDAITKSDGPIARSLFFGRTPYGAFCNGLVHVPWKVILSEHPYKEFFGLVKDEIVNLLIRFDCYSKENLQNVIMIYSYSTRPGEQLVCTSLVIKYLYAKEFYDFRCPSEIFKMNCVLQKCYEFSPARHSIDKLLSASRISMPLWDEVNKTRVYHYCSFLSYLTFYGFFNHVGNGMALSLSIANEFIHRNLEQSIIDYYGHEINEKLEFCAKILNDISSLSPHHFYYNLIKEFRKVAIAYSNEYIEDNITSIQCIADILAKTKFDYHIPITNKDFATELSVICFYYHGMNKCNNSCEKTMFLRVENETPIQTILATIVEMQDRMLQILSLNYSGIDAYEKFFVGIRTDQQFRFAIGWLVGTDLKNAQYIALSNN